MSPSVDDVLSCLQKNDEAHQDFYQKHAEVLTAKLHTAFQNITNVICTEDPNISGTDYRVDAYVETPTENYLLDAKLSMSSGATLETAQKSRNNTQQTRHPRGGTHSPPTTPLRGRKTAEGLHRTVYGRTDHNDSMLAPRLGQVTLVTREEI